MKISFVWHLISVGHQSDTFTTRIQTECDINNADDYFDLEIEIFALINCWTSISPHWYWYIHRHIVWLVSFGCRLFPHFFFLLFCVKSVVDFFFSHFFSLSISFPSFLCVFSACTHLLGHIFQAAQVGLSASKSHNVLTLMVCARAQQTCAHPNPFQINHEFYYQFMDFVCFFSSFQSNVLVFIATIITWKKIYNKHIRYWSMLLSKPQMIHFGTT